MTKLKILNLYAGIGGNRKLWDTLEIPIEVTAIENNEKIAKIYQDFFPNDKVIVADAHQYLLEHFKEFDFIWSSPPCITHSSFRFNIGVRFRGTKPQYPDLKLYEEIIFLDNFFGGKWVVENVKPFYKSLIPAIEIQRHLFWSNFPLSQNIFIKREIIRKSQIPDLQEKFGFDLSKYEISNKRQILRNCVNPELGLHILKMALKEPQLTLVSKNHSPQNKNTQHHSLPSECF